MEFETYELTKAHLNELGYNFLSGNEIFATFVNATGNTAFSWQNGVNEGDGGLTLLSSNSWYSEPTTAKNTFEISRDKICQIKKRKASFDDFVERWCLEQKLIELN